MKVGILKTGAPPAELQTRFGSYGWMFQRLLGPSCDYATFDVRQGEYPTADGDCSAYLITGSAAGIHDGEPWIETLKSFLRGIAGRVPMIGICFGHQIMAEAFGGRVIPSLRGWAIGLHTYEVLRPTDWMDDVRAIAAPASHRDQVIEIPEGAQALAASVFTPFAALYYPSQRAVSFQFHPEFTAEYAAALIEARRGAVYSDSQADDALASLQGPHDGARIATWIRRFVERTAGRR